MSPLLSPVYPDNGTLAAGLGSIFGAASADLVFLERVPDVFISTFPSEVIRFRLANGTERRVWCKYDVSPSLHVGEHRGGVEYEGAVYRDVLAPLRMTAPAFHGWYTDGGGRMCLVVEYVADGTRLSLTPGCERHIVAAARWIGKFHAATGETCRGAAGGLLRRYNAAYYQGWADRTWSYLGRQRTRFPWLRRLCLGYYDLVAVLASQPPAVVHGEYYPANILIRAGGLVSPVDWEAAAAGAGEVDLVSLIDGWPAPVVKECGLAYQQARWPAGKSVGFQERMRVAQLYWHFRWLGDRPQWTNGKKGWWRFEQLRRTGERLGVI